MAIYALAAGLFAALVTYWGFKEADDTRKMRITIEEAKREGHIVIYK